ncbi:MAG: hypothetical protein V4510_12170 [bacterium]
MRNPLAILVGSLLTVGAAAAWRIGFETIKVGGACAAGNQGPEGCLLVAPQTGAGAIVLSAVLAVAACVGLGILAAGIAGVTGRREANWFWAGSLPGALATLVVAGALQEDAAGRWVPSVVTFMGTFAGLAALTAAVGVAVTHLARRARPAPAPTS